MASSSTPAAIRDMQKDLEVQANASARSRKARTLSPPPNPSSLVFASKPNPSSPLTCAAPLRRHLKEPPASDWICSGFTAYAQELELLNDGANVYKLIGPVLVKQDLAEAKANVKKRIEYISAELKRMDRALKDLEDKQNSKKESIFKLQQRMQAIQAGQAKA
ncbi:hypothetical protein EJB05_25026, partial [Eragrostis curvula]